MFKFKIVDRESYNNLIDLCNKVLAKNDEVLAKNDEVLSMASKIHKFNEHLLNLNGLSVNKENEDAEN